MTKNRKDLTPRRISKMHVRPKSQGSANIKVVVRVRPPNAKEREENHRIIVKCSESNTLIFDPEEESTPFFFHGVKQKRRDLLKKQHKNMQFAFDQVFDVAASNEEVFINSTKSLINILMDGCNCSVFVYGATGAGKTYTMLGKPHEPGITVLTMKELFERKSELSSERDFELFVTYLEVYNENVRDLLKPTQQSLQLREDTQFGVRVAGLTHKKILSSDELFELLDHGNKNRTQHPTDANAESSRSHAVFQVYLQMIIKQTGQTIRAKLSMIDLAGSERGAATGCRGMRFTEGANINKSLLALGNCINSLADGQRHVPYRNSKLTRILKDSLGGNCHTVMIANTAPSSMSFEDTYNTLKYANRAKNIKLHVKKNVVAGEKTAMEYIRIIETLNEEIKSLKDEMQIIKEENKTFKEGNAPKTQSSSECTEENSEASHKTFRNEEFEKMDMEVVSNNKEDELKNLYRDYHLFEERRHLMASKKSLLKLRINYKDEANSRLSGFSLTMDPAERANNLQRINQTVDRLRRQTEPFACEVHDMDSKMGDLKEKITTLIEENPFLRGTAELEQLKIDRERDAHDKELLDSLYKVQSNELQTRGELMDKMSRILYDWYFLLKNKNLVTEEMTESFQSLKACLLGCCNVKFEDSGDSGLSTSSSSSSSKSEVQNTEELRSNKRKLAADTSNNLNSTFVAQSNRPKTENTLFKEFQPSPAKKVAKAICLRSSPRLLSQKGKIRMTPIGTMGTSARFPGSNKSKIQQTLKRPFR